MFDASQEGSHRERDDDYRGELYRLGGWRVIICRERLQFIFQRRRTAAQSCAPARWESRHYPTTRDAVLRLWAEHIGPPDATLMLLPEHAHWFDLADWNDLHGIA